MKRNKYLSVLVICIIGAIIGCKKPVDNTPLISQQDYPVNVGDRWVYQVSDNMNSTIDTQTLVVTHKSVYSNDSIVYSIQTFLHGNVIDTSIIISSPTAYAYVSNAPDSYYSLFKNLSLKFPITAKSVWSGGGGYLRDSIFVLYANQKEVVLNNTYTNVCEIKRQQISVANNVMGLIYVAPKIGIIYQNINVNFGYPVSNQTIRLISYDLH